MTKAFILQGLECANCAGKIERAVKELEGVRRASLNFMTSTLRVETAVEFKGNIHKIIRDIVSKYEPDVKVINAAAGHNHNHAHGGSARFSRLLAGALILGAGAFVENFFEFSQLIPDLMFVSAYALLGWDILLRAVRNISRGNIFDENFLMAIATIGALILGEYAEAVGVMLFYQVGRYFQDMAVSKSKKAIAELMDIRPDYANLEKNGQVIKVDPETVEIGDMIIVKAGEKIPLDGVVAKGTANLDTAALTGESVPRKVNPSDPIISGCVNLDGALTVKVTKIFGESTVAKIIDLVESAAEKKAPTENFITKFAKYYTPAVVAVAALLAIVPPLLMGGDFAEWFRRGLIFLVISCPCALVLSIPMSYFGGIGGASRRGILVKGGNFLEALANLDIVVFDKTGTLTKGIFTVTKVLPAQGKSADEVLELAAFGEALSNHPIAKSILRAHGTGVDKSALSEYEEIAGQGISVRVYDNKILAGNHKLMEANKIPFPEISERGTKVYVASRGLYAGCIIISDEIKPDSSGAVASLKAQGIRKTVMLTGDIPLIAESVAKELNLDEAHGGLLPHEKVSKLEVLMTQKRSKSKLAFVGDGINDAPVLAMADVGVAMGGLGSDAAIEAADVVLMTDEPSKLAEAVDIARFTKRIVWQNIIFSLGIKGIFLILGAFGLAHMWEAVFADVGVALIAILNAMRVLRFNK